VIEYKERAERKSETRLCVAKTLPKRGGEGPCTQRGGVGRKNRREKGVGKGGDLVFRYADGPSVTSSRTRGTKTTRRKVGE